MSETQPTAPAHFVGLQDGCGIFPPFALYLLDEPVGVHPAGSTVSRWTLESHGYVIPDEAEAHEAYARDSFVPFR